MRKNNSKNIKDKYTVKILNDDKDTIAIFNCCSYKDIVLKCPILKNEETVRNYFRYYKSQGTKYKNSKNKFNNIEINKIELNNISN
tara:strand:+ start:150 stop:407 length:258 start_codon:yes stop_codon:yes gene_type:complete